MKRLFLAIASVAMVMLIPFRAPSADPVSEVRKSLWSWAPKSVQKMGSSVRVILPQRRITEKIYEAAVIVGICGAVRRRKARLAGVKEIRILNQWGAQGYVFEGGRSECIKIVRTPMSNQRIQLLGMTHLYTGR